MTPPLDARALDHVRVKAHAKRMGLTLSLPEQFAFLEARGPLHLQAAPGSGKTTLVALKLALIADGWSSTRQGICVLSHTNTATQEIAQRLTGRSQRLLRYPHFIGTIQSFVHTFLSLPALRSQGVTTRAIDDEVYAQQARRLLDLGQFRTLRSYTRRRPDGIQLVTESTYLFEPGERRLQIRVRNLGRESESYRQLLSLKLHLAERGVFRYQDMYAIAARHLHRHTRLGAGLRMRFPFVVIDEMQDTDAIQSDILDTVFGDTAVVQCVGDVNQRIYSASTPVAVSSGFPDQSAMELPTSH
ncbi:UvrD-helicase domain-containing protein [Kitasatospora sp. NPDC050463]|uniref:UvrD-helicase domain-containing protein n=1 Tax=Kitasatospora sp. NPDC050463 TaxID=3155786 RepID=UPI0033F49D36